MKRSLGPQSLLYPHPVLIVGSYDAAGKANLMNAAWGGICCSKPPCVAVSLRPSRHSYDAILQRQAFTISVPSTTWVEAADYVGIASGKNVDKFAETGLTAVKSELVDAPYVAEFPLALECRLLHVHELGIHHQLVGEILDVKCDESALDEGGKPDIRKIAPFLYAGGGDRAYFAVGDELGKAFSIGRRS